MLDGFDLLPNGAFSRKNPLLQIALDSTSLTDFKLCPRRYYYSIVYGFQPAKESVHLAFGIALHTAVENYWTLRLDRQSTHKDALFEVVKKTLLDTWDSEHSRPMEALSEDKAKNRYTLIRTIVWYLEKYQNDPIEVVRIGDKLAIELPFKIDSKHWSTTTGEQFILCGRLDRIGELHGQRLVTDVKSTGHTLDEKYYAKFNPNNQFTIYTIAAKSVFGVETDGILVDACRVIQSLTEFHRAIIHRTKEQIDEWNHDLGHFVKKLEECAYEDDWPMNDSACEMYGGCPFRQVCSKGTQTERNRVLRTEYKRRVWDPTFQPLDI